MPFDDPVPEGTKCARCLMHPATDIWSPDGILAAVHGHYHRWCACCVVREQIRMAENAAGQLSALRRELAGACVSEAAPDPDQLIRDNEALRKELESQWLMAHFETCGRRYPGSGHAMNYAAPHPEGEWCYWPRPKMLKDG